MSASSSLGRLLCCALLLLSLLRADVTAQAPQFGVLLTAYVLDPVLPGSDRVSYELQLQGNAVEGAPGLLNVTSASGTRTTTTASGRTTSQAASLKPDTSALLYMPTSAAASPLAPLTSAAGCVEQEIGAPLAAVDGCLLDSKNITVQFRPKFQVAVGVNEDLYASLSYNARTGYTETLTDSAGDITTFDGLGVTVSERVNVDETEGI